MMDKIPDQIKDKVKDIDWSKNFIFEDMPCDHDPEAKDHVKINCDKCNFDKRELWLENALTKQNKDEKTKDDKGNILTLNKITVIRGKFDDCIGIQKEFQ